MKLNQGQEKPWDLDSALAYIEGDQQSLSNGKGKKKEEIMEEHIKMGKILHTSHSSTLLHSLHTFGMLD